MKTNYDRIAEDVGEMLGGFMKLDEYTQGYIRGFVDAAAMKQVGKEKDT